MRLLAIILILLCIGCSSNLQVPAPEYKLVEVLKSSSKPAPAPAPAPPPSPAPPTTATQSKTVTLSGKQETSKNSTVENQLTKASMAFSVPVSANINDTLNIQLLVNPLEDPARLATQLNQSTRKFESKINVSKVLSATLTAPEFKVEKITPETQVLHTAESTEWRWRLKPNTTGDHTINLSIVAIVKIDGEKQGESHIKTFDQTVTINIKPGQVLSNWLEKYWQWLVSTLLLPLGLWIYKNKFEKSKDHH